jgi:hypothetical protein
MSRTFNPAVYAYKNMDIENMPKTEAPKPTNGLLSKKINTAQTSLLDLNNPLVRVAKQMEVIRKYREEIKNGTV